MGADFSKFQGVLRFALQILLADNLKDSKCSWRQGDGTKDTRNEQSGTKVCSLVSVAVEFQESP
jgi:hypothetical protein